MRWRGRDTFALVTVGVLGCMAAAAAATEEPAPSITVETGTLAGSVEGGVESWKGIPYAAPPIGPLRWRAPQPVAPWNGVRQATAYGNDCKRLRDAGEARSREARGEPVRLVPVVPDSASGFTERTPQLYREGYDYYRTPRAQHANSPNRYVFSSLPQQMAFFPFEQLDTISPRPLLLVAGSKADTLFWSRQAYEKAREPKELHVVEGATHIDMYDRPQFVGPAVGKLAEFFGRHLADVPSAGTAK